MTLFEVQLLFYTPPCILFNNLTLECHSSLSFSSFDLTFIPFNSSRIPNELDSTILHHPATASVGTIRPAGDPVVDVLGLAPQGYQVFYRSHCSPAPRRCLLGCVPKLLLDIYPSAWTCRTGPPSIRPTHVRFFFFCCHCFHTNSLFEEKEEGSELVAVRCHPCNTHLFLLTL